MKYVAAGTCVLIVLIACDAGSGSESASVVSDSLGVIVVENSSPAWKEGESWHLAPTPAIEIGRAGIPEYELSGVMSLVRLVSGAIVVADAGSQELRWFDESGAFVRSVGGRGEGPGEFTSLRWIAPLGPDSIVAHDEATGRITVFDTEGVTGRSTALSSECQGTPNGVFDGGSLLVSDRIIFEGSPAEGFVRPLTETSHCSGDGRLLGDLPNFPGREMAIAVNTRRSRRAVAVMDALFGRRTAFASTGDGFAVGTGDTYQLRWYGLDGELRRIVRWQGEDLVLDPKTLDDYVQYWLDRDADAAARRKTREFFTAATIPDSLPAFGKILMDSEGNTWVEQYAVFGTSPGRWWVLDGVGQLLGSVETPPRFDVHQIGADFVLGVWRDELDIEKILLYLIEKP